MSDVMQRLMQADDCFPIASKLTKEQLIEVVEELVHALHRSGKQQQQRR